MNVDEKPWNSWLTPVVVPNFVYSSSPAAPAPIIWPAFRSMFAGVSTVLAQIKSDADLQSIPVVVLTTSDAEEDVLRSYNLHANAYVTKPVDFERFLSVVRQIDDFFVTVVKLPSNGAR